jgi:IS30 family transposase
MKHYTQLTQEQRYQIYALMKAGLNQTQTAAIVGVDKSTIGRELRRNTGQRGYRPQQAHQFCLQRRQQKAQPRIASSTWRFVERLLREEWSPEQIAHSLRLHKHLSVSHEWIYQHVLADKQVGGTLYRHLRCQKQRRKRYGVYSRRGRIPQAISIEQRPAIVDTRRRVGDWELDTVIGRHHRQALVTLVERKSRIMLTAKVLRKTAEQVNRAVIQLLKPLRRWVHTITVDNGKEFTDHQTLAKALHARVYFAHPFASWERGLNENTNGLIRQYFPKKHDFTRITQTQIEQVMDKLNNRPRKCLGFKTPNQVFFGIKPNVALAT